MQPWPTLNLSMTSINHLEPGNVNNLLKLCFFNPVSLTRH
jgi:hypothetical protein